MLSDARDRFSAGIQQVANALYGLDQRRAGGRRLQLGTQAGHPDSQVGQLASVRRTPNIRQHLFGGDCTAGLGGKFAQQEAFLARQRQSFTLTAGLATLCVDLKPVNAKQGYTASSAGFFP